MPYPILLVLGGLGLGFVPISILPDVVLRPELVFLLFLPPLLYWASLTTPWREFRAYLRPILLLAIGLVVATIFGVAWIAQAVVPALTWSLALVLARLDSLPTDGVAPEVVDDIHRHLTTRAHSLRAETRGAAEYQTRTRASQDLRRDLLRVERRTILQLRDQGDINDQTLRRIQRDLDLEEMRLGPASAK